MTTAPTEPGAVLPCPDDDHDYEFVDDSFDHEYGTERIHFMRCKMCDHTRGMKAGDYECFGDEVL